jgi:hypothetical protein
VQQAEYHGQEGRKTRLYSNGLHLSVKVKVKVKVKLTLEEAKKAQRRSRGIALLFL